MKTQWRRLLGYARGSAGKLSLVVALALLSIGLDLLRPWPLKVIVDDVLPNRSLPENLSWLSTWPGGDQPLGQLAWLAFATLALVAGAQLLQLLQVHTQTGVGNSLMYALGGDVLDHILRLSPRYHGRQRVGDLVRRVMTDSSCVRDLVLWVGLLGLTSCVSLVMMWAVMWKLNPGLSLVAVGVVPFLGMVVWWYARPMAERAYQQQQNESDIMALAEQTLTAMPIVQLFGREEEQHRQFEKLSKKTVAASLRSTATQLQFGVATRAVMAIGSAGMMLLGGWQVLDGHLQIGGLLVFLSYLSSLYAPLETLAYLSNGLASARAGARRVQEILDVTDRVADPVGPGSGFTGGTSVVEPNSDSAQTHSRARSEPNRSFRHGGPAAGMAALQRSGSVRFENVTVGYEPERPVLQEVSFDVQPGEWAALVGPTGGGKSTLAALIPRLFDPWSGRIVIDGVDAREWRLAALRSRVALVAQEPLLWPITVKENIRLGRPSASDADVETAARAARADDFIQRLPQGYDTVIGERGATLSGGERQRLSLARALLRDASIVIFDEPTSALDAATEAAFLETAKQLLRNRTVFIIAHRFSTIRSADHVIVLERGRVTQAGTPAELAAQPGLFRRLWEQQKMPGGKLE